MRVRDSPVLPRQIQANGRVEGNYTTLDLQQIHTGLVDSSRVAHKVLATVVSYYPGRGEGGTDEALCDAGGIVAMSKDTGPIKGYGWVSGGSWFLKSISQEHGILGQTSGNSSGAITMGGKVEIIGRHACMIAAAHPWYYIIDSSTAEGRERVADVWVPLATVGVPEKKRSSDVRKMFVTRFRWPATVGRQLHVTFTPSLFHPLHLRWPSATTTLTPLNSSKLMVRSVSFSCPLLRMSLS